MTGEARKARRAQVRVAVARVVAEAFPDEEDASCELDRLEPYFDELDASDALLEEPLRQQVQRLCDKLGLSFESIARGPPVEARIAPAAVQAFGPEPMGCEDLEGDFAPPPPTLSSA
jgi:hypothetical protein